jgi:plastocyanin
MKMRTKNIRFKACAAALLFLLGTSFASAHGAGGTIEIEQDGYLIDIGYSEVEIFTGVLTQLSFLLFEAGGGSDKIEVPFTDIWVRLERDGEIVFASLLGRPEFGDTGMSFNFTESGDHDLFVRYKNADSTIIERTVRLSVSEGVVAAEASPAGFSGAIVLSAAALSFLSAILLIMFFPRLRRIIPKRKDTQQAESDSVVQAETKIAQEAPKSVAKIENNLSSTKYVSYIKYIVVAFIISVITFFVTSLFLGTVAIPQWDGFTQSDSSNGEIVSIVLTESGYEPSNIVIKKGTTVEFTTTTGRQHWPASSLHPTHNEYPEFDPLVPVEADESWSFTFDETGTWSYHDHLRSYFTGKIEVVPAR